MVQSVSEIKGAIPCGLKEYLMKTFIKTSTQSKTGYELVIRDEQGNESTILIQDKPKNEPFTLILPENPSNRKYFNSNKVDKAGGIIELTYKQSITIGAKSESRKSWQDYLTEEEKQIIDNIRQNCEDRKAKDKKPELTKREKLELKIKKLQAQVATLRGEE